MRCCSRKEGCKNKLIILFADGKEGKKHQSWLLRLLECELFDVSYAVTYLFKSKEPGVLAYIVNRMFDFDRVSVDFYLPQLVNMYVQIPEVAEALHPYLVFR
jgi:phosphatidylinositol 4-kinase